MICIQKIYGFQGLNHLIIEESRDVTPVMNGRTNERTEENNIGQCSELNQKPQQVAGPSELSVFVQHVQGVPKKMHFQNAAGATVHWLNHHLPAPLVSRD